jgi:hypothetical protein
MSGTRAWLWLNLLSLDAPIIALLWQDLAARSFATPLRPAARIVLGLTVWAVYLADRLLDIRTNGRAPNTPRHNFYRRHARVFTVLLVAVVIVDAYIATVQLRHAVFVSGLAVACCVGAYLAIFPLRASGWEKQVVAAILFSVGVLLAPGTWLNPLRLLLPGVLFGCLCLCNLVLMELWEHDREPRLIWLAPAAVAGLAIVRSTGPWQNAVALSGVLLVIVAITGPRLTVGAKSVLADAALLTPLLFR